MRPTIASAKRAGSALSEVASIRSFVCRDCLARGASVSAQHGHRRFYAEKKGLLDSERWRRKIWGTDNPPGPKDPYTESQLFPDQNKKPQAIEAAEDAPSELEEVAPFEGSTIEEAQAHDPDYKPAVTSSGVPRVGGASGWWEQVWDEDNQFQRWAPPTVKDLHPKSAANFIHRAFVEIMVLKQAGLDIMDANYIPLEASINYNQIRPSGTHDNLTLSFPEESWRQHIISAVSVGEGEVVEDELEVAEDEPDAVTPTEAEAEAVAEDLAEPTTEELTTTEAEAAPQTKQKKEKTKTIDWSEDNFWRHIKITDDIKFALVKRVMQLTGTRISDSALTKSSELGVLMKEGFRWQPPKQLAQELLTESKDYRNNRKWEIAPNVTVHTRRVTFVNKEKSVGRWKAITKQLKERDLPVPKRKTQANY